jgi:hypothetical protein
MLYIGLWNHADEHSRAQGDPRLIKGQVFPYDDDLTVDSVTGLLDELAGLRRVIRYTAEGGQYLYLPKLARHQRLEDKVPSRLPPPPDGVEDVQLHMGYPQHPLPDGNDVDNAVDNPKQRPDQPRQSAQTNLRGPGVKQVAGSRKHVAGKTLAQLTPGGSDSFAAFWLVYPRKVAKGHALKAWAKAVKLVPDPQVLVEAAAQYAQQRQYEPPQYTKYPATWLNGQCWLDEPPPQRMPASPAVMAGLSLAAQLKAAGR